MGRKRIRLRRRRLKEALSRSSLSQNGWALRIGISSSHLSMLLSGERRYPSAATRAKLLGTLDLRFQELFEVEVVTGKTDRNVIRADRQAPHSISSAAGQGRSADLHSVAGPTVMSLAGSLLFDLRLGLRTLAAAPAFTLTALAVLALGVGVNGAVFAAIRAAWLAPLPYQDPDRLVLLDLTLADSTRGGRPRAFPWSWPKYQMLAAAPEIPVEGMAAYAVRSLTLTASGPPLRLDAEVITPGYFGVLQIPSALGRTFSSGSRTGNDREVILSGELWRTRFGSDPDIVGSVVTLNGSPMNIVGVAPRSFHGLSGHAQLWVPVASVSFLLSPTMLAATNAHWLQGIGRMQPGAGLEQLQSVMASVGQAVDDRYPLNEPDSLVGGDARLLAGARRHPRAETAVGVVAGGAAFVLLMAAANLAALILTRGRSRRYETAVRVALGGSQRRVAFWLMSEALLLAVGGGVIGVCLAASAVPMIAAGWPAAFTSAGWNLAFVSARDFAFDSSTLVFTVALALTASLIFGVIPAVRLSKTDLGLAMRKGSSSATSRGWVSSSGLLVSAEVALALLLLVGSGLMLSSLNRLLSVERGFDPTSVLTFRYSIPPTGAPREGAGLFTAGFLERIRGIPQVVAASDGCVAPTGGHCTITAVARAGDRVWEGGTGPGVGGQVVEQDYFKTLGIRLLEGRTFGRSDRAGGSPVVVLSRSAAEQFFPEGSAVGQPFAAGMSLTAAGQPARVVGVVADVLYDSPEQGVMPEVYYLQRQDPQLSRTVVVRTRTEPFELVDEIRAVLRQMDPDLPIYAITTLEALSADQMSDTRLVAQLLTLFSIMALMLASTGIWGIVAAGVTSRRRELSIRMALGARAAGVVRLVVTGSVLPWLAGSVGGTLAALGLSRLLRGLLYEVGPNDPGVLVGANIVVLGIAVLAAWVPARRATRVDPVETLRTQ